MTSLLREIRYSIRMLTKNPGFTAVALITVALGIGANTAIFSVINTILLRPLPFRDPDRIVFVWSLLGEDQSTVSLPDINDWKSQSQSLEATAAYTYNIYNIVDSHDPEQMRGAQVSGDFFRVLGVDAMLGRTFTSEDERIRLVILSYPLWQKRYGSDAGIVGKSIGMNNESYTVLGVMPKGFEFPSAEIPLWTTFATIHPEQSLVENRKARNFRVIARLKSGRGPDETQSEMTTIARRLEQQYPDSNSGVGAKVISVHDQLVGEIRPTLLILLGMVGLVLLIACANVANLFLVRSIVREREMAIRSALGASRGRVVRQLLTESLIISLGGGLIGLLLALLGVKLLIGFGLERLPRLDGVHVDLRLLLFTLVIALITGVIFGLAPVLQTWRVNLSDVLKEGGRSAMAGVRGRRAQNILVVVEIALTTVLLVGAGLAGRRLVTLLQTNPGIRTENLLTFQLSLPAAKYKEDWQRLNLFREVSNRALNAAGVQAVALGQSRPPDFLQSNLDFLIKSQPPQGPGQAPRAAYMPVSANYFATLGVPLLKGRLFTENDKEKTPGVAIINDSAARRFFPNQDPLGQQIKLGSNPDSDEPWSTVVGIVGDVKYRGLDADAGPTLYYSYPQSPPQGMYVFVRTTSAPESVLPAIRGEIRAVDPELPLSRIKTMSQLLDDAVSQPRFLTVLIGIFAGVALFLAAIGIYGVIAYSVAQRTQEIGLRMALGANPRNVLTLVVGHGFKLAIAGILIGLLAAFALTRVITTFLFGVEAMDPLTYVFTALILLGVAIAASYLPARRATKVDPLTAVRYQ
jgi:putative ABC transport system permease protein